MQNNLLHIISTRFLVNCFNRNVIDLFSYDNINRSINVFKDNLYLSLKIQTNKNFKLILLIDDSTPNNIISYVKDEISKIDPSIIVFTLIQQQQFIKRAFNEYTKLILTRIDYDDFIIKTAVNEVINEANNISSIGAFGYIYGYTYDVANKKLYDFSCDYQNKGHFSAFQSFIIDTTAIKYSDNIKPHLCNHPDIVETLTEIAHKNNCTFKLIQSNNNGFVYMRHTKNQSIFNLPNKISKNQLNIEENRKQLKDYFNLSI